MTGHPEIFVIGDTASLDQDGHPLPGVAQVAMQQGRYAGRLIDRRLRGKPAPPPFRYFDKGNMAVVGKGFAVLQSGRVALSGFLAGQRGARLIVNHHGSVTDTHVPASSEHQSVRT